MKILICLLLLLLFGLFALVVVSIHNFNKKLDGAVKYLEVLDTDLNDFNSNSSVRQNRVFNSIDSLKSDNEKIFDELTKFNKKNDEWTGLSFEEYKDKYNREKAKKDGEY